MSAVCSTCGSTIRLNSPTRQCSRCLLALARTEGKEASSVDTAAKGIASESLLQSHIRSLGDYQVLEEIGRGGMGRVYRARQLSLDRIVALKVIAADELASPKLVERFRTEAEAAASLDHPNIVSIYDVGEDDQWNFFSMRLVEGQTLSQALARGPLQFERTARLLATVARAIHHAHERGVLHRDLKPGNILLDVFGEPHVTDFGLAKFTQRESDLTLTHTALGTPAYMSPEQAAGRVKEVTTAADIYGLGAVLFEMLTGGPPFTGETPMAIARQVIDQEPSAPSSINAAVPKDLACICLKCLEKDPTRRYPSAMALVQDLERGLRHEPISAQMATPLERARKWVHRKPLHTALAATVLIAIVSLLAGLVLHNRRISRAQRATQAANQELAIHLRQVEWQQAEESLAAGRTADAMSTLARFLQETPADQIVAKRLISLLETRAFPLPALPPFKHGTPVNLARMDVRSQRLFTVADDGVLRSWNLTNGVVENQAALNLGHEYLLLLPDGHRLVAATKEGRVIVWDLQNWKLDHELGQVRSISRKLAISDDGRWASMVTPEDEVQLWATATGTLISRTNVHETEINLAPTLGSDGETVIRGRRRGVWLWRPEAGELVTLLATNEGPVFAACDWPRRRAFVSLERTHGTTHGIVCIDLDTGRELFRKPDAMPWHSMQVTPDGKRILVSRWMEGVNVLDAKTLNEQFPSFAGAPVLANISPNDSFQIGFRAFHDGSGRLYDLRNGQPLVEPIQHEGTILNHELSPDGRLLVTASQDGTARLWDLRMRSSDSTHLRIGDWIHKIVLSPDEQQLAVAAGRQVRIYEVMASNALAPPLVLKDGVPDVNFSPDGRFLAIPCADASVRVVNWRTGEATLLDTPHERRVWEAVFSPDGRSVASASEDATARVFEAATGRMRFPPLRHENSVTEVSFSPDNTLLATASVDATARLWDAVTGQPVGPVLRHQGTIGTARFSGDSRRLLTASYDRTAQIWETRTGKRVAPLIRSDQGILGALFSDDGRRVLIHTLNSARIFNAQTSEPLTPPMRHANRVARAVFSPDGRWVATGSDDRTARVWDARSGLPVTEPLTHRGVVTSLVWLPDSRHLMSGSQDGRVRLWKLPEMDSPPAWLPALAEALAGKHDDGKGGRVSVSPERLDSLRQLAKTSGSDTPENRWLRWFLVERLHRAAP